MGFREDLLIWEKILGVEHFFDKLSPLPGAKEMFDTIYNMYGDRCEILTEIPKLDKSMLAKEDKICWIRRLFSEKVIVNIVDQAKIADFCTGKGCILISDLKNSIKTWEDKGGTGILFKSAEDTLLWLRTIGNSDFESMVDLDTEAETGMSGWGRSFSTTEGYRLWLRPYKPIEEMELTVRHYNCLKNDYTCKNEEEWRKEHGDKALEEIREKGRKSLEEVQKKLKELGFSLPETDE